MTWHIRRKRYSMIKTYEQLPEVRSEHSERIIVFMGGIFDLIHVGHVRGMQYCKRFGEILTVGVVSDERAKQRKGPKRPIIPQEERLEMVDSLSVVDYAFIMPLSKPKMTPTINVLRQLKPDIFMDHEENTERWLPYIEDVEAQGIRFEFNRSPRPESTTAIISKIIEKHSQ